MKLNLPSQQINRDFTRGSLKQWGKLWSLSCDQVLQARSLLDTYCHSDQSFSPLPAYPKESLFTPILLFLYFPTRLSFLLHSLLMVLDYGSLSFLFYETSFSRITSFIKVVLCGLRCELKASKKSVHSFPFLLSAGLILKTHGPCSNAKTTPPPTRRQSPK